VVEPFEMDARLSATNPIDAAVLASLRTRGIEPANLCSDAVFVRRVYIDLIGTLPKPHEVTRFLADTDPRKRARLIDALMEREEFADYWRSNGATCSG